MDITFTDTKTTQKILSTLKPILEQYLPDYSEGHIKIKQLSGTTNQVYKIILENNNPVVFRFLSPIVDRDVQGRIIMELSNAGIIPKCYYTSRICRLDQYLQNCRHAQPSQIISTPSILKCIIKKVSQFHKIQPSQNIKKTITIQQMFSQQNIKRYQQAIPHSSYNTTQFQNLKRTLIKELDAMKFWLESNFGHKKQTIKFCHNDLNNLNIFIRDIGEGQSQGQKQAILIDFDYIGYNYIAYQLANFLNETCIQYKGAYPGFNITNKLAKKQIKEACSYYTSKYQGLQQDIQKMLVLVNYYWAFWSILIKPTLATPAFCPLQHGIARWQLAKYYKALCQEEQK